MEDYLDLDLPHWSLDREPRWRITWTWPAVLEPGQGTSMEDYFGVRSATRGWIQSLKGRAPLWIVVAALLCVDLGRRWSTWAQVLEAHTFGYINNCRQRLDNICRGTMVWQHLLAMKAMVRFFAVAKKIFPFLEFFSFSIWWCSILLCSKIIFPLLNFALFNLLFRKIYLSVY